MLKSIEAISDPTAEIVSYQIADSSFVEKHSITIKEEAARHIAPDLAVIAVYSSKNRNVSRALAEMYDYYAQKHRNPIFYTEDRLSWYKDRFEKYYPELNFNAKYYKCLLRHMATLRRMRKV